METAPLTEVQRRELEFHDDMARALDPASMPPGEPGAHENYLLQALGDIRGLRVLELGCGDGGLVFHLLDMGAEVTANDLSPGMVDVARARVEHFRPGATAHFSAGPVEATGLESASFDVICGKWIVHHVDVDEAGDEIHRLLRPGGRAVFFENQGRNRLLAFAREHVAGRFGVERLGTPDEHLLVQSDFDAWASRFGRAEESHPDFAFFEIADRQLTDFRYPRLNRLALGADRWIWQRLPRLRRYSFHVILTITKGAT